MAKRTPKPVPAKPEPTPHLVASPEVGQVRVEVKCAKCDPCVLVLTVPADPADPTKPDLVALDQLTRNSGWHLNRAGQPICPDCR